MGDQTRNNRLIDFTKDVEVDNPLLDATDMYPVAPLHLPYEARKFWDAVIASLPFDWFISADLALLEMYCLTYVDFHKFRKMAEAGGHVYENDKGELKKNPYWDMAEKNKITLMTMSGKLKFNVKAREGDTLTASREKAKEVATVAKTGRRKGLMFIPGGKA